MTDARDDAPTDHVRPQPLPRTDLITAAVILAFALAVIALAWRMPTFTESGGDPFTAPGIVPGFYGIVLAVLGVALAARSIARGALGAGGGRRPGSGGSASAQARVSRLAAAVALCLLFSLGLVGRMPFWLAVAIFVTAFVLLFEWRDEPPGRRARRVVTALLLGLCTGAAVTLVFEKLFLVRLP